MYRANDIRDVRNIIGWRQNFNNNDYTIDTDLTVSEFGQYFQGFHPLVTLDNMKSIAPDFSKVTFPDWAIGTAYAIGDKVAYSGIDYEALTANTGQQPDTATTDWKVYDAFSDWLRTKTEDSLLNLISSVQTEKLSLKSAKNLVENKVLFDSAGRINNSLANTDLLVGFEIIPIRSKGVTTKIERIETRFAGPVEDLKVYVMHSSQKEPVKEITLARTKADSSEWFVPAEDIYLPYMGPTGAGGSWFICYDQREVSPTTEALIKDYDWSTGPCRTCSTNVYQSWVAWSKFLEVMPFNYGLDSVGVEMWDISKNIYPSRTNYGLNLEVTVQCDTTEIIQEQRKVLETAFGLQMATDAIKEMAFNPAFRINRTEQNFSQQELLYILDGDSSSNKKSGLVYELEKAKKALSFDFNEMSRVCFTCKNGGVKYRSV
jgi:hypothetical protein